MTPEIIVAMTALHFQTQPALQVFLQHFEIPEGRVFTGEDWGGWNPA
jgi:hypothetical protein